MDLLNTLLDTGKKMATDALAEKVGASSEQSAETFLGILFQSFSTMDAAQKAQIFALFTSLASSVSSETAGVDTVLQQFKDNPLVRQWAGNLAEDIVKRLSSQFLS